MENIILVYQVKISLPFFDTFLTKNIIKVYHDINDIDKYISDISEKYGLDKKILSVNYISIDLNEYNRIKAFVKSFKFKDLQEEEVIYILLNSKDLWKNSKI